MKSITSKYAIERRNEISKEITKNWDIIAKYNLTPKDLPSKFKCNYDLKTLIQTNIELMEERILLKLYLQCINMGYKKFSELPKTNNYLNIFTLCERKEYLFKLNHIPTLDKKLKRTQGKKNLDQIETLTSDYLNGLKKPLELEIINLQKQIDDFNETAELDIESPAISLAA